MLFFVQNLPLDCGRFFLTNTVVELMNIKVHLLGALVDYLPDSDRGQAVLSLEDGVSIAGLLGQLGITRRVEVGVNDEHDQDQDRILQEGDAVLVFSNFGGG